MPAEIVSERPIAPPAWVPDPPSRRTTIRAIAVGIVLIAAIGVAETRRTTVAVPPVTASPEDVVRAYVAAVDAGDRDAQRALSTAEHDAFVAQFHEDVISIRDLHVKPAVIESAPGVRPKVAWVGVRFDVRRRPRFWRLRDDDIWGYQLVRTAPGERWLITGEGKV